jgi:hypothetical protein
MHENLTLWRIAQEVTDKVLGKGTYQKVNGFSPAKGETHKTEQPKKRRKRNPRIQAKQ